MNMVRRQIHEAGVHTLYNALMYQHQQDEKNTRAGASDDLSYPLPIVDATIEDPNGRPHVIVTMGAYQYRLKVEQIPNTEGKTPVEAMLLLGHSIVDTARKCKTKRSEVKVVANRLFNEGEIPEPADFRTPRKEQ